MALTDEQQQALAELEKRLRQLAHGATQHAEIAAGTHPRLTGKLDLLEREGHPAAPEDFAMLARLDLAARFKNVMGALDAFEAAMKPGPLALVETEAEQDQRAKE
jgi:hypothetical protein